MKQIVVALSLLTLLLSTSASAVTKVRNTDHGGFYVGFGIGFGSLGIDFNNSDVTYDREGGGAGVVFLGGAIKPNLLLGLDVNAWSKKEDNVTRTISTSSLCLTYYVAPRFFVKGGIGVGSANVEVDYHHSTVSYNETGFGLTAGAGMEFRLTRHFALVPSTQWSYQSFDSFKSNVFSITFNIGWYW
jgi:opacity protein-like surface antigen